MLVEADGKLVTQHALLDRSWPDTYVEDNTLQVHLSALRRALGDGRNRIMTVPRRGFRLVQRRRPPGAASDASHPDTSRPAALARQAIRVLQPPEVVGRAQAVAARARGARTRARADADRRGRHRQDHAVGRARAAPRFDPASAMPEIRALHAMLAAQA